MIGAIRPMELAGQPIGLLLRGQRLVRHFRQEELGFVAFLVGHHEAGDLALRLEGVAHLGHFGPGGRRLVGIEPGVLVELLVVVDDVALQRRRDEVELAVGAGERRFSDQLRDQVGQLVVERDQAADQVLGLRAAIGPDHVRTGLGREGRAQQRVVLGVRLRQEGERCARMRGLECGLGVHRSRSACAARRR